MPDRSNLPWYQHPYWRWREDRDPDGFRRERDSQRSRAYRAERWVYGDLRGTAVADKWVALVKNPQRYIDSILKTKYFVRRWGQKTIKVERGRQLKCRHWGLYINPYCGKVKFAGTPESWVVLHELAHAVTPEYSGGGHGRYWARTYADLVGFRIGRDAEKALKARFRANNVRFSVKRPPTYAPHLSAKAATPAS